ncbi:MAG: hypothetical protein JST78_11995 [Bacteroidetes bacterium]|nr:hypothetical protein [Bacteroidota bacterium]
MSKLLGSDIVTIIIALIAGLVALYQVKSNVISEARIKWIENLREILSSYCCELEECSVLKLDLNEETLNKSDKELERAFEKFYLPYSKSAKEVLKLQSKALLYLDSKNPKHKRIEELMRKNSLLVHEKYADNRKEIQNNIQEIIIISKDIFENEWEISKKLFRI